MRTEAGRVRHCLLLLEIEMSWSCRRLFLATVLMSTAFNVAAQGSIFPKGTARPPDGGDPRSRGPVTPDYRQYEYGKEVYAVKLGCTSCPLGESPLDETIARKVLSDESLRTSLSSEEDEAVTAYLRQLYGILF